MSRISLIGERMTAWLGCLALGAGVALAQSPAPKQSPASPTGAATSAADPANWIPASALLYFGVPNVEQAKAKLEKIPMYQMFNDPALAESTGQMAQQVVSGLNDMAQEMGFESYKEVPWPQNGVALALFPPAAGTEDPQVVVVLDSGNQLEKHQQLISRLEQQSIDKGYTRQTEEFEGVKLTTLTPPAKAEAEAEAEDEMAFGMEEESAPKPVTYGFVAKKLIVGSSIDVLKPAVRLISGKNQDSLAKTDKYRLIEKRCDPIGELRLFLDVSGLIAAIPDEDGSAKPFIEKFGLNAMKPVVGTVRLGTPTEGALGIKFFIPAGGQDKLANRLFGEDKPVKQLVDMNAGQGNIGALYVAALKMNEFVDVMLEFANTETPGTRDQALEQMKALALPSGEQINLYDNFIQKLTGPVALVVGVNKPYADDSLQILLDLGHSDMKSVDSIIKSLAGAAAGFVIAREMNDQQIYDVMSPIPLPVSISMTVTKNSLGLGTTPAIEQKVRAAGDDKPGTAISASPVFQALASKLPNTATVVGFQDETIMLDYMIDKAGQEGGEEDLMGMGGDLIGQLLMMGGATKETLEASRKYATGSMSIFRRAEGGWEAVGLVMPIKDLQAKPSTPANAAQ